MTDDIRVVHVDDEPGFAELTAEFLQRQDPGLVVDAETSARDALDRLATGRYDCVVSDYDMPELDGLELLEAVREAHGDLPFLLYTGKGSEEIASDAVTAGVTDYLQKDAGEEQYQLLANRVRNAVERYRAQRRADKHARINDIVNDVNQALVRARSRTEVETAVCDVISDAEPYAFAWVGCHEPETGEIRPRESAGDDRGYLQEVTVTAGDEPEGRGPAGTAVRSHEIQVTEDVADDPAFEPWRDEALDRGFRAVAAVPLVYDGTLFGVLVVYADRPGAFDGTEVTLLEELAGDVAHALDAIEIREELERHRTIVQASGDPVFAVDPDGRISFVNAAFEDLAGYDGDDLVGRPVSRVLDEDGLDVAVRHGEALLAGDQEDARFEVAVATADGDRVPCEVNLARLPSADGARGVTGVVRDVSHRKRREAELAAQAEKIARLHDVATTLDGNEPGAVFERIVAAAEDVLEFDRCIADAVEDDELVPRAVAAGVSEEDYYERTPVDAEDNLAARAYRTGESSVVDDIQQEVGDPATEAFRSVLTVPIGDHGVFQAAAEERAAFDDADLELAELLVAHAEGSLRHVDQRAALTAMHTAASALMDAGTPAEVCARAVETIQDVLGRWLCGIWLYDDATGALEPVAWTATAEATFETFPTLTTDNSVAGRAFQAGELRVFDADEDAAEAFNPGTSVGTELALPLGDHGVIAVGATERDAFSEWEVSVARTFAANVRTALSRAVHTQELQERRRELAAQNDRLERFANLVSHDLRNPLNTALGRARLADEAAEADEVAVHLDAIDGALERMDALIDDVLRLARDGQVIDDPEPVDLAAVARDAWRTTDTADADLAVADDLPTVRGDRRRLRTAFENLFRNSAEHGSPTVTVTVGRLDATAAGPDAEPGARERDRGDFYVADDGAGLPDVDEETLFEPGYSGGAGTGFGLAIVDEIAGAHGWTVTPADAAEGGARFEFTGVSVVEGREDG